MRKYITLDQRGCVHGNTMTSFLNAYGKVVYSLVRDLSSETDGRIYIAS